MKPYAKLMLVAMLLFWAYKAHASGTLTCNASAVATCQEAAQEVFSPCMGSCVEYYGYQCRSEPNSCENYPVSVENIEDCTGGGSEQTCTEYLQTTYTGYVPDECQSCVANFEDAYANCISEYCTD
jgi:hypothetical protein